MAKPITGIPPFTGKAATWLGEYLNKAEPDPEKEERAKRDREVVNSFVPLSALRRKAKAKGH